MKRFLALLWALPLFAGPLPLDEEVITGKLENGLTYLIRENHYPEGRAQVRLVVKVGSAYESEEERGIAHLVEHLVFRGSDHFADHEVIQYMESIGAEFGPDANAFTGIEETVYVFDIPCEESETLERSLLMLSDFAGRAHLKDESIDSERGIVLDELRLSGGVNQLAFEKEWEWKLKGSHFQQLPGGYPDVVKNAAPDLVRRFYQRYYRPDRMAVLAVGDFDPALIEKCIRSYFSSLTNPEESFEEIACEVQEGKKGRHFVYSHPEISSSRLTLSYLHEQERAKCEEDLKCTLAKRLIKNAFNERLSRQAASVDSPFLSAGVLFGSHLAAGLCEDMFIVMPYDGSEIAAFERLWQERERLRIQGLTSAEVDFFKSVLIEQYQEALRNVNKLHHDTFTHLLHQHFIKGDLLLDYPAFLDMRLALIQSLTDEDLNQALAEVMSEREFSLSFITHRDLDEVETFFDIMKRPSDGLIADVWSVQSPSIHLAAAGEIVEERAIDDETHFFQLSNGMQILCRPTQKRADEILFYAVADRGYAGLEREKWDSAKALPSYLAKLGVGGLDGDALEPFCRQEGITLSFAMTEMQRILEGSLNKNHLKSFFDVLHGAFQPKKGCAKTAEWLKRAWDQVIQSSLRDPSQQFWQFVDRKVTQNHPLFAQIAVDKIDQEILDQLADDVIADPSSYTFIFVGDFTIDQLKPFFETHLASIPNNDPRIPEAENISFDNPDIAETFTLGSEKIGVSVVASFMPKTYYSNGYQGCALRMILERRLSQVLRRTLADTYTVSVSSRSLLYPQNSPQLLYITFSHSPEQADRAKKSVREAIDQFFETPPTTQEMASVKEILQQDLSEELQYNYGTLKRLIDLVLYEDDQDPLDEIEKLTAEEVSDLAKLYLTERNWMTFTWVNQE